jgi:hypothetical protein
MPYLSSLLRTILLFSLILCLSNKLFAQSNFYKFNIGGGFGATWVFADTKKTSIDFASYGSIDYYLTRYMTLGFETQRGKLSGGEYLSEFHNSYSTVTMNGKIHAGEFLSRRDLNNVFLNSIRGVYVSAGVGLIKNNVNVVNRNIKNVNRDVIFPLSAGTNFYFLNNWGYSRVILNINIQAVASLEDGMDGDLSPYSNFNDIYNFLSIGLKYNFGPMGLDKRR